MGGPPGQKMTLWAVILLTVFPFSTLKNHKPFKDVSVHVCVYTYICMYLY